MAFFTTTNRMVTPLHVSPSWSEQCGKQECPAYEFTAHFQWDPSAFEQMKRIDHVYDQVVGLLPLRLCTWLCSAEVLLACMWAFSCTQGIAVTQSSCVQVVGALHLRQCVLLCSRAISAGTESSGLVYAEALEAAELAVQHCPKWSQTHLFKVGLAKYV